MPVYDCEVGNVFSTIDQAQSNADQALLIATQAEPDDDFHDIRFLNDWFIYERDGLYGWHAGKCNNRDSYNIVRTARRVRYYPNDEDSSPSRSVLKWSDGDQERTEA